MNMKSIFSQPARNLIAITLAVPVLAGCFGDIGLADLLRSFGVAGQAGQ